MVPSSANIALSVAGKNVEPFCVVDICGGQSGRVLEMLVRYERNRCHRLVIPYKPVPVSAASYGDGSSALRGASVQQRKLKKGLGEDEILFL